MATETYFSMKSRVLGIGSDRLCNQSDLVVNSNMQSDSNDMQSNAG